MAARLTARTIRQQSILLRFQSSSRSRSRSNSSPPLFPAPLAPFRAMASDAAAAAVRKYEWLVVIPDKPGTLEKRLEIRP